MSKKVTNKTWLDYKSRKLNKKKRYKKKNKNYLDKSSSNNTNYLKTEKEHYLYQAHTLNTAPSNFSLINNTMETISFFNKLISEIRQKTFRKTFFIDSSNVENVTVDALIYLIAIMQNIQINYDMKYTFKGNLPKKDVAAFIYKNSGFMSYVSSKIKKLPESTDNMRIVSDNKNNPMITKELCQFIMAKLNKKQRDIIFVQKVLIELMSNVYHHAYNTDSIMINHWYLYAEYLGDRVRCVFLDTGAGIAKTVRKNHIEKIQRLIGTNASDADLILSTLQGIDLRTQTGESYRGNGLSGVRTFVETPLFQNFSVFSGKGHCILNNNKEWIKQNYNDKIYGTIYMFDVV